MVLFSKIVKHLRNHMGLQKNPNAFKAFKTDKRNIAIVVRLSGFKLHYKVTIFKQYGTGIKTSI